MYSQSGTTFRVVKDAALQHILNPGVYNLGLDRTGFYLDRISDDFEFSYEPEVIDEKFINNIIKVWNSTNRNLGMLLSGVKGTGKTVTAKLLCNELNLPIICIGSSFGSEADDGDALSSFLQSIETECIVFIDEYEKLFSQENLTPLKILDSAYSQSAKKMFILTSNKATINENMVGRPSRLRYIKEFGNLSQQQLLKLVNKFLNEETVKEKDKIIPDVVTMLSGSSCITVDIVKSVCNEINILGWDYDWFKNNFNLDLAYYQIYGYHICVDDSCPYLTTTKLFETAIKDFIKTVPNIVESIIPIYDSNSISWVNNSIICAYLLANVNDLSDQLFKNMFIDYINKQVKKQIHVAIQNFLDWKGPNFGNTAFSCGNIWKLVESYISVKLLRDYEDYFMNNILDHNIANMMTKELNDLSVTFKDNRNFFAFICSMLLEDIYQISISDRVSSSVLIDSEYMDGTKLYTPVSSLYDITQLNHIQLFTEDKEGKKVTLRNARSFTEFSENIGQFDEVLYNETAGIKSGIVLLNHDGKSKLSLTFISKIKKDTKYTF